MNNKGKINMETQVESVMNAKHELEKVIKQAIDTFENKTGIVISNIELHRSEVLTNSYLVSNRTALVGISVEGVQ